MGTHASYRVRDDGSPVTVAPGLVALGPIEATFEDVEGYTVTITVAPMPVVEGESGRFVCEELRVRQRDDGPPVTLAGIRTVPVARLTSMAAAAAIRRSDDLGDGGVPLRVPREMPEDVAAHGPTDEALEWVAFVYRAAVALGDPPTRAVESLMGLARSTAGRWVALARERGYLGPAEGPGKRGG